MKVNGIAKQTGDLAQMIWACDEIVAQLSEQYRLMPGDLIYTGTPAGVGPMSASDTVEAFVEGVAALAIRIAPTAC